MKRLTLFFLCLITSIGWAAAQNRIVKGTVISSEDNQPIIGANVVVVGHTTIGAQTDLDGNFTINNVPASAKQLRFSYTGMTPKVLDISDVMSVVLDPDAAELETVVVLGYGSGQKLGTVSGSVARVSGEKLAEKPVANVMDALQGQVAGMQVMTGSGDPTAVASVTIHGSGSLTSGSAPLYIVDGVPTNLSVIATLNPNDFESLVVLKDASATSIYGARAANGVVVIQTKRGKAGERGRVTFNAMYGVSTLINKRPFKDMMTGAEFVQFQDKVGYFNISGQPGATMEEKLKYFANNVYEDLAKFELLKAQMDNGTMNPVNFDKDTDWLDYYMRPSAPTTQGDISFQGGSAGTNYFASLGYFNQEGISREVSLFSRYTGRFNLESRLNDWLKVGANLSGAYADKRATGFQGGAYITSGTFAALVAPKYLNPFNTDGSLADAYWLDFSSKMMEGKEHSAKYNGSKWRTYQAVASGYIQLNPVKGLTLKAQAGFDLTDERTNAYMKPNNPLYTGTTSPWNRERFYQSLTKNFTNTAEYKWNMDDMHDFTVLLGHEFVDFKNEMFGARANGYESDKFMLLSQGKTGSHLQLPEQAIADYAYLSFFGRLSYSLDNWAHIDLSLRNDRSSRFGVNKRSAMFYSIGTSFDIYKKFIKESEWLNDLRFKASYGTTGNSDMRNFTNGSPEYYAHLALVSTAPYTDDGFGLYVSTPGNPDLSWEQQSQLNLGVTSSMFNNRLSAELDFYVRQTNDMLMEVQLPYASGFTAQLQNVGSLRNVGFDIMLRGDIVRTKDWNVYASTTFNYNRETILEIFSGLNQYVRQGYGYVWTVGKPTQFYNAEYAGVYKGKDYVDENGNQWKGGDQMWYVPGQTNADGSKKVTNKYSKELEQPLDKNLNPPITGGFSFGASWKGLSLDADFAYIVGKWMINNDRYFTENSSGGFNFTNKHKMILDAWTPENPTSDVPRIGQTMQFDSRLLENASFLRLKNLKLTYALPESIFKGQGVVSSARVFLMARNLFTITKFKGFDPEAGSNLSMNQFPNSRQYMAGLQVSF